MNSSSVVQFLPENYNQKAILDLLQALSCTPGLAERLMRCLDRFPDLERQLGAFEDKCRTTVQRCEATERLCQAYMCPGNVNFSQRTLDEYSNRSLVKLKEPVTGLGGDFVNAFPVPPGKKIRLTHPARPGFTPTRMRVDMNIAGGGNNYSDFTLQFYLVPGGVNSEQGLEVGNSNDPARVETEGAGRDRAAAVIRGDEHARIRGHSRNPAARSSLGSARKRRRCAG
jgi:hypothetical protein